MSSPEDITARLKHEFDFGESAFIRQLRPHLIWDSEAFVSLTGAMEAYCRHVPRGPQVDLWAAKGFWLVPGYVKNWTTHPGFPREHPSDYYDRAYARLDGLAWWFFTNLPPFTEGHDWSPVRP